MQRTVSMLVLVILCAGAAFADDAPMMDRAALVAELQRTEAKFLASIEGLSAEQWNYKPSPERWSIAECAEHIAAAEPFIRGMIAGVMETELAAESVMAAHQDDRVTKGLLDRTKKASAPEPLIPTNRFGTPAAAVEAFEKERAATIALASGDVDLRTRGGDHFIFGPLDTNGWFLFLSSHSERHTAQIEEVKGTDGYPK